MQQQEKKKKQHTRHCLQTLYTMCVHSDTLAGIHARGDVGTTLSSRHVPHQSPVVRAQRDPELKTPQIQRDVCSEQWRKQRAVVVVVVVEGLLSISAAIVRCHMQSRERAEPARIDPRACCPLNSTTPLFPRPGIVILPRCASSNWRYWCLGRLWAPPTEGTRCHGKTGFRCYEPWRGYVV